MSCLVTDLLELLESNLFVKGRREESREEGIWRKKNEMGERGRKKGREIAISWSNNLQMLK